MTESGPRGDRALDVAVDSRERFVADDRSHLRAVVGACAEPQLRGGFDEHRRERVAGGIDRDDDRAG
jgi:hypothetical protein